MARERRQLITLCVKSNTFCILLLAPWSPLADLSPSDAELVEGLRAADCSYGAPTLTQQFENLRVERLDSGVYLLKKVERPSNEGFVEWLPYCPEAGWFRNIPSESTEAL